MPSSPHFSTYGPISNDYPNPVCPGLCTVYDRIQYLEYEAIRTRVNPTPGAINAEVTVLLAYEQPPILDFN